MQWWIGWKEYLKLLHKEKLLRGCPLIISFTILVTITQKGQIYQGFQVGISCSLKIIFYAKNILLILFISRYSKEQFGKKWLIALFKTIFLTNFNQILAIELKYA